MTRQFTKVQGQPLTEDDLRMLAPSIFAPAPHESRSAKYTYIPTSDVLRGLVREGFQPVLARQSHPKDEARREYTKHMVRFRRPETTARAVGDVFPEIVLVNSHDGTSAYKLMAGLFRLACLNGMVVNQGQIDEVKVPHKGDVVGQVIEGAFRVIESSVQALEAPRTWSQIQLEQPERMAMAEAAHTLRFGDADGRTTTMIKPEQLLQAQRYGDDKSDLWTTFNVLQENATKGGLRGVGRDANNRVRNITSRAVNGIDGDIRLNRALWTLAARMAELKAA